MIAGDAGYDDDRWTRSKSSRDWRPQTFGSQEPERRAGPDRRAAVVRPPRPRARSPATRPSLQDADGDTVDGIAGSGRGPRARRHAAPIVIVDGYVTSRGRPRRDRHVDRRATDSSSRPGSSSTQTLFGSRRNRATTERLDEGRGRADAARGRPGRPRRWSTCSGSTAMPLLDVPLLERERLLEVGRRRDGPRPARDLRPAADRHVGRLVARRMGSRASRSRPPTAATRRERPRSTGPARDASPLSGSCEHR